MRNSRVFNNQPRTILISSGVPSQSSFGMRVALARMRESVVSVGLKIVCIASGEAFFPRVVQSL